MTEPHLNYLQKGSASIRSEKLEENVGKAEKASEKHSKQTAIHKNFAVSRFRFWYFVHFSSSVTSQIYFPPHNHAELDWNNKYRQAKNWLF